MNNLYRFALAGAICICVAIVGYTLTQEDDSDQAIDLPGKMLASVQSVDASSQETHQALGTTASKANLLPRKKSRLARKTKSGGRSYSGAGGGLRSRDTLGVSGSSNAAVSSTSAVSSVRTPVRIPPVSAMATPKDVFGRPAPRLDKTKTSLVQQVLDMDKLAMKARPKPTTLALTATSQGNAGAGGQRYKVVSRPLSLSLASQKYTIQKGDTFSNLAVRFYGNEKYYLAIVKANAGINPNKLKVGQLIVLPGKNAVIAPPSQQTQPQQRPQLTKRQYLVKKNDNLSTIAHQVYGHEKHWRHLFKANRQLLKDNPNALQVGQVLRVPPLSTRQN